MTFNTVLEAFCLLNTPSLEAYHHADCFLGTLASELKRRDDILMKKRANPNWRATGREDSLPLLGDECKWYRVILDEAQWIKNKSTKQAQAVSQLQALTRFCMTGTPMSKLLRNPLCLYHFHFRVTKVREQ